MNKIIVVGESRMGMSMQVHNIAKRYYEKGYNIGWLNDTQDMFEGCFKK